DPFHELPAQQHDGHGHRDDEPGRVVRADDDPIGYSLASRPHNHGFRGQVEPGDGVEQDEEERDRIEREKEPRLQPAEELRIAVGALGEGAELPQIDHGEEGDEHAGQLAEDESGVGALLEPPPDRHAAAVPPWMIQGVMRPDVHRALQGRSSDLTQRVALVSLYCWMAPAGSTCLGQTFVHSPTNVHCQMPSCSERIFSRSAAPRSRESMLYRWARAMAAGPMKLGSSP